jgi:hypothetical protein
MTTRRATTRKAEPSLLKVKKETVRDLSAQPKGTTIKGGAQNTATKSRVLCSAGCP